MKLPIYLDHHATTPVDPEVLKEMLPYFAEKFGNASSVDHLHGAEASDAVKTSRRIIAEAIGAKPLEIVFTSGATESDNLAVIGTAMGLKDKGRHIITAKTEHKAILDSCKKLEKLGFSITYLDVDQHGCIDVSELERAITRETILITIMAANNEIGTIAPLKEIGKIAKTHGVVFHTDATQLFGREKLDVDELNIDLMSISGHKIYGPKGIGALYIRHGVSKIPVEPILLGGGHERGYRSGTLNVPGIVGLAKATEIAHANMKKDDAHYRQLVKIMQEIFEDKLKDSFHINGHPTRRLSHNLNISINEVQNKALINLVKKDISISTGAACTTEKVEPSHVLLALNHGDSCPKTSIRIGVGRFNTEKEVEHAAEVIVAGVKRLRKFHMQPISQ